jgi:hypothetical protein
MTIMKFLISFLFMLTLIFLNGCGGGGGGGGGGDSTTTTQTLTNSSTVNSVMVSIF